MARATTLMLAAVALVHLAGLGIARPLEEDGCAAIKAEMAKLVEQGARRDLDKGAEWGKANLNAEQLARVARLIELDEGISFRCPRPKPVVVAVPTDGQPAAGAAEDGTAPVPAKGAKGKAAAKSGSELGIDPGLIDLLNPPADAPKPPARKKAAPKAPKQGDDAAAAAAKTAPPKSAPPKTAPQSTPAAAATTGTAPVQK